MREVFLTKGQIFGKLTVIKHVGYTHHCNGQECKVYRCKCECGNLTDVRMHKLRSGKTQSCGCLKSIVTTNKNTKHAHTYHVAYSTWNNINTRCYNKKDIRYKDYGGRGIKVYKEWRGTEGCIKFCEWAESNGYKAGLQIERKNNNGNYEPKNCIFVTAKENSINRRNTMYVTDKGLKIPFREFYDKYTSGLVTYNAAYLRLKKGRDKHDAIR